MIKATFHPNPKYFPNFEQLFCTVRKTSLFFTIKKLLSRILSNLEELSDEEIDKGIAKLEETEFKGIKEDNNCILNIK